MCDEQTEHRRIFISHRQTLVFWAMGVYILLIFDKNIRHFKMNRVQKPGRFTVS